jgi:predicted extracellular nuclease
VAGLMATMIPAQVLAAGPVYINEIQVSTTGPDWEFVEIQGAPATDLTGYTLVGVESDSTDASAGRVDLVVSLTGQTIPADGFWVALSPTGQATYGPGDAAIADNSFENSTATYFLVSGFSGAVGNDLDTNNDGVLDATPWTAVADSVNLTDSATDFTYGATSVGPDGTFLPSGTYRCPDAPTGIFDTNIHNFNVPDGTPGAANTQCPVPPVEKLIHEVQGSGASTPFPNVDVIVEGVVVGDFQGNTFAGQQLGGFHLQEEPADQDSDPNTSEGIFVFAPSAPDVSVGDVVRVTGTAVEFFEMTEITDVTEVTVVGSAPSAVVAAPVSLPVAAVTDWEKHEGMLVGFDQNLYISEYFNFDRFGEIVLTNARQFQPTQLADPGSAEATAIATANTLGRITLDDGRNSQNPDPAIHPNGEEFTLANTFRGGDILQGVTGVVDFAFGLYRIQPTQGATHVVENPRPDEPDRIKGPLRVASFNVLNFFTTIDQGPDVCGPTGLSDCRGADTQEEYDRQLAKLIAGIIALDADIVGLQEVENDVRDDDGSRAHDAILTLVEELNAAEGPGTWAWVGETNHYNDYPIRNEIIYRTSAVTPVGPPVALENEAFDKLRPTLPPPGDVEPVGRPPLAQTFTIDKDQSGRGNRRAFTVVVNHFKSKGGTCADIGDPDTGDGQDSCNLTRMAQAEALLGFIEAIQQSSGDPDVLVIGDLNSYAQEDPVRLIEDGVDGNAGTPDDFTELVTARFGSESYSFVFNGQLGSLDHALASPSLTGQVEGVTIFHINADEPDILDYDTTFKLPAQDALYEPLPYRVSDHDPVIVGLRLAREKH